MAPYAEDATSQASREGSSVTSTSYSQSQAALGRSRKMEGSASARSCPSRESDGSWRMPTNLAELGVPAGCRSDRVAGRTGEMGDHGIDAYAVGSNLLKCSRNGVDPRAHQKLAATGLLNTKGNPPQDPMHLPVSSGLIGQPAGSRLPYDSGSESARSVRSSRSEGSLRPMTLAEAGVAAGVHSYRMAGERGEVCDPAADHHAHQQLHKTPASMNVPAWEHPHAQFAHLKRVPRTGVSSGLIGQRAGEFYPGHEEDPFEYVTAKNYGNYHGYSARRRGYEEASPYSEFMETDQSQLIKNRRPTPRAASNAESLRSSRTSDAGISEEGGAASVRSASKRSEAGASTASSAASRPRAKAAEPNVSARSRASSVSSSSTAIHLPSKEKKAGVVARGSQGSRGSSTTTSYLRGSSRAESSATHSAAESKGAASEAAELEPAAIAIDWQDLRTNRRRR